MERNVDPQGKTNFVDYKSIYGDWQYMKGPPIEPAKTALIIIDMQAGMLYPDASNYMKAYSQVLPLDFSYFIHRVREVSLPNSQLLLGLFRELDMRVVHVWTASETEDFSDFRPGRRDWLQRLQKQTGMDIYKAWQPGMQILPELAPLERELVVLKKTGSAFNNTTLDEIMRNMDVETLVLVGGNTNGCVFETGIYAEQQGYFNILVDDATHAFHPDLHNQILELFPVGYGRVRTTEDVVKEVRAAVKGAMA